MTARMGVGRLASWMYDHPTSYVVVLGIALGGLLALIAAFAWAVVNDA